ncbi:Protein MSS51, mitochondrial [Zancudomyces culisetae]|uniref:Protein MSS51, mitochondrial n=1 Tax=Zancudomyces culisetae TaxID=1213189 RepID=A0A1R1PG51_ZANCU|nr:Protein MSS51, mitochondrial [Zancudomyces culisetae]OMH79960.1 Protein MSS51, mitochondrial [Zancudomyces culisetae]OMH85019.1 Protein MSS51, mitochondrial [Zancudomyces culisetae]|eukprot:OMH79686.1 Protein MSS51, mitochondrial [Zancudomyces culisetae]
MVEKGKMVSEYGVCPICAEEGKAKKNGELGYRCEGCERPKFECPDCGYPTHCSEEHWKKDTHHKEHVCGYLRQANEDEHDLRSGRKLVEFEFPSKQSPEMAINFSNWDTFLYTRGFLTLNNERAIRHASKLLTYPVTIGSVLHPYSYLTLRTGLTPEGSKSLSALRATIREHEAARFDKDLFSQLNPIRVFILGARSEAMLPPYVYLQLHYLLPHSPVILYFVGPECIPSSDETRNSISVSPMLSMKFYKGYFHDLVWSFAPFDPYTDVFFMFSPGVAHPAGTESWAPTIEKLLETKCAIFGTGFNSEDMNKDVETLNNMFSDKMDWLVAPRKNPFLSMKTDFSIYDLRMWAMANHGIYSFRGKKYEVEVK